MHRARRRPPRSLGAFAGLALLTAAAACGDRADPAAPGVAATSSSTTAPASTSTPDQAPGRWVQHDAPADCMCADGSDYVWFSRVEDPERVLLYFQGGGACFSAETCRFESGTYEVTAGPRDDPDGGEGIFDLDDPRNPFAGWSMVFVPYCTGDVHLGDATTTYAADLTVEHNGYRNARAVSDHLLETFPAATEVFVAGSSAGGVPAPLFGGLLADALPAADVGVLADASGGYPSSSLLNSAIGGLWGVYDNLPDWPEVRSRTPEEIGIPDLFWLAGTHAPRIRMGRYDNVDDEIQRLFASLVGEGGSGLAGVLERNEELVEGNGVDLSVYVAPGDGHTILGRARLYDLVVEGTPFVDWLTTLVEGGQPGDVRCADCAVTASG